MATNTTNFDLVKPAGSDNYDIDSFHNGSMDKIDSALQGLGTGLAIISKNNTHGAISSGEYVYVHGHGSLAEGLYKANTNIAANGTLTSSNLTAVSGGLGKDVASLSNQIGTLNSKITPLAPDNSRTQINFNAQQAHTVDLGVTPTSDKHASVLLMVAGQGVLSEISCTGSGAVKTDFGTALSSVSLSGSTLTINFASRPWGLCVALVHHN